VSAAPLKCRFCSAPVVHVMADLGVSPLANSYLREDELGQMEPFYPLRAMVCGECFLVQLGEYESPEAIFGDYAYFSSYSSSWLEHSRRYAEAACERFGLGPESRVVEVASNDGYLLRWFRDLGVPVLGVEPAGNVAAVAREDGIRTLVKFFGRATAREIAAMRPADLLVANNVLAHVPDLNDFVAGLKIALAPDGVVTVEFPHLLRLVEEGEWDTIYHEHFSYFSFATATRVFARHGLVLWDVEELPTHGGSLRIYGRHAENESRPVSERARELLEREHAQGLDRLETYDAFQTEVDESCWELLDLLVSERRAGHRIAGYGAPAKGNTLLNRCGIGRDLLEYTVDVSPHKQGRFLPGTRIPILAPDALRAEPPDLVFILPWNLRDEIAGQLADLRDAGTRFLVRSPRLEVF
jgi:SAM-dependent methyltransferase